MDLAALYALFGTTLPATAAEGAFLPSPAQVPEPVPVSEGPPSALEDWVEAFEERAAILEFDAGLARADAERLARAMLLRGRGKPTVSHTSLSGIRPLPDVELCPAPSLAVGLPAPVVCIECAFYVPNRTSPGVGFGHCDAPDLNDPRGRGRWPLPSRTCRLFASKASGGMSPLSPVVPTPVGTSTDAITP